ncbi:hypothetical protein HELRODRAFT_170390 [Helobdella robusta]|uniref:C2 domain-containing protein n=1 Tax=Helobdella robusta TaxID=6412 RepID=T1F2Z9_HELRO|nr:hypothetical protein HELRODRAFT_170390 [Helobdella robusta]ESO07091.1 hypothetical protein HELRODRAFT_170390 [Helobdella robusta]
MLMLLMLLLMLLLLMMLLLQFVFSAGSPGWIFFTRSVSLKNFMIQSRHFGNSVEAFEVIFSMQLIILAPSHLTSRVISVSNKNRGSIASVCSTNTTFDTLDNFTPQHQQQQQSQRQTSTTRLASRRESSPVQPQHQQQQPQRQQLQLPIINIPTTPTTPTTNLPAARSTENINATSDHQPFTIPTPLPLTSRRFSGPSPTNCLGTIDPSLYRHRRRSYNDMTSKTGGNNDCMEEDDDDEDDNFDYGPDYLGKIRFGVSYSKESEKLTVVVMQANKLPSRNPGSADTCDPFIKFVSLHNHPPHHHV